MNKKLSNWEHEGWVGVPHSEVLRCLAAELKARKAPTIFKIAVPGSEERARCKHAAALAKRAARDRREGQWELTLPPNTALPGLSLQGNRQRVFYRGIREVKTRVKATTPRPSTSRMLDIVRKAEEDAFSKYTTNEEIWKSLTTKDILPRQELVWKAAETLWKEKEEVWPEVSLGTILGCGLAEFRDEGKVKAGRGGGIYYTRVVQMSEQRVYRRQTSSNDANGAHTIPGGCTTQVYCGLAGRLYGRMGRCNPVGPGLSSLSPECMHKKPQIGVFNFLGRSTANFQRLGWNQEPV
ncbi:hypothetical protein B0H13DRAFT_1922161 [Mycena leptocephala]|nr:hypothetical protein B0H13DRAFT_1922161 [Mycena leptocephala]